MELRELFPVWEKLTPEQQRQVEAAARPRTAARGAMLHSGPADCEGREITLYRLFARDICLLSAACMLRGVQFDVAIEAEKDTELWVLPADRYKRLMEESAPLANYTNSVLAERFSDVMWLVEQVLWKSFDKRLAAFLLEEAALEGSDTLRMTHETIGRHLGSPREVVTRMLRYFQGEGLVRLARGSVELTGRERLRELAEG